MLALQGAAARAEAQSRLEITTSYLAGMLTHWDPEKAPSLDELLGDEPGSEQQAPEDQIEDPRSNALAWIAVLGGKATNEGEGESENA